MTAEEYKRIISERPIPEDKIKRVPFSSKYNTFGDYAFDLILLIEFNSKNISAPDWLVKRIIDTQDEFGV